MTSVLYSMRYSPWSERARFALLHHRYAFEEREHVPLLDEIPLRVRARRYWGRIAVPLLIEDGTAIMDSLAIAEHVDRTGAGSRLFPEKHLAAIRAFSAQLEPMFEAARGRALKVSLTDDEAALDLAPPALRKLPFAIAATRLGTRYVAWKHPTPSDGIVDRFRRGLVEIRSALSGRAYIHDDFSYADILAASGVQLVAPVAERFLAIGPVKRRTWADARLAVEFADLVTWRDKLYDKHRPLSASQS